MLNKPSSILPKKTCCRQAKIVESRGTNSKLNFCSNTYNAESKHYHIKYSLLRLYLRNYITRSYSHLYLSTSKQNDIEKYLKVEEIIGSFYLFIRYDPIITKLNVEDADELGIEKYNTLEFPFYVKRASEEERIIKAECTAELVEN